MYAQERLPSLELEVLVGCSRVVPVHLQWSQEFFFFVAMGVGYNGDKSFDLASNNRNGFLDPIPSFFC